MSTNSKKRRAVSIDLEENPGKRTKLESENPSSPQSPTDQTGHPPKSLVERLPITDKVQKDTVKPQESSKQRLKRVKINKLVAPRPFPAVAVSNSATGPRSAHKDGKNYICLTRKTSLAAYMRRCKNLVIDDGYKTLHLHAAGAAIPLLTQLSCALSSILPFSEDEIHTQITTGTVEVQDEIIPEDEDEDITYRSRGKSTLYVVIRIGGDQSEKDSQNPAKSTGSSASKSTKSRPKKAAGKKEIHVYQEPEQVQEDI